MRKKITTANLPILIPTVDVLRELLTDKGLSLEDLQNNGLTLEDVQRLQGETPTIDQNLSAKLGKVFGLNADFWVNMDQAYQAHLAAGKPTLRAISDKRPSGNLSVRLPRSVHERLIKASQDEDVSINQLVLSFVSEGLGRIERRTG